MKNYEEKEKRLEDVLLRLTDLTNKFGGNQEDVNNLNIQKNHLISEKKVIEEKYEKLLSAHRMLQERLGN